MISEDPGTEAEYLDSRGDYEEDDVDLVEAASETRQTMRNRYSKAVIAVVGSKIQCPACGKRHIKTTYQKVFCRNKGKGNCKDRYWNSVDEVRSIRAGGALLW